MTLQKRCPFSLNRIKSEYFVCLTCLISFFKQITSRATFIYHFAKKLDILNIFPRRLRKACYLSRRRKGYKYLSDPILVRISLCHFKLKLIFGQIVLWAGDDKFQSNNSEIKAAITHNSCHEQASRKSYFIR